MGVKPAVPQSKAFKEQPMTSKPGPIMGVKPAVPQSKPFGKQPAASKPGPIVTAKPAVPQSKPFGQQNKANYDLSQFNKNYMPKSEVKPTQQKTASQPNPQKKVVPSDKSCYGASNDICETCNDVVNAYKKKNWGYDVNNFIQCKKEQEKKVVPSDKSCYGASNGICETCNDVVNAYKKKNWAYDVNNFIQCKKEDEKRQAQQKKVQK
jgi:hypothetical protein